MVKVSLLLFLFVIQFLLIFIVLAVLYYRLYQKHKVQATISQGEVLRLRDELQTQASSKTELLEWKEMFNELQGRFEQLRQVNSKLTEALAALTPESERTEEYKRLVAEIEQSNKEIDTCIGTLSKDNESLVEKMASVQNEVKGLSKKLGETVHKSEYEAVIAEKNRLELQIKSLKKDIEQKDKEYKTLEKNYMWLEKEYNALYENVSAGST